METVFTLEPFNNAPRKDRTDCQHETTLLMHHPAPTEIQVEPILSYHWTPYRRHGFTPMRVRTGRGSQSTAKSEASAPKICGSTLLEDAHNSLGFPVFASAPLVALPATFRISSVPVTIPQG